jgi:hypothetical protein
MRKISILLSLLILIALSSSTFAEQSTLSIVDYTITPDVLMPGDAGTLEITLKNTGSTSLKVTGASLYGGVLKSKYVNYQHIGWIAPSETLTLSFPISAGDVQDGSYYPQVVISIEGGESLVFPIHVRVDSSSPELHLVGISSEAPLSIVRGAKAEITLEITNPRDNSLNSLVVEPEIENAEVLPQRIFIGTLEAHSSEKLTFEIYSSENFSESSLKFRVSYKNGENSHERTFEFPLRVLSSSSSLKLIPVETRVLGTSNEEISIEIDVANSMNKEISSVSVISLSDKLSPKEYYIGKMNPDDVFTARFKIQGSSVNGTEVFGFKGVYVEDGILKETSIVHVKVTVLPEKSPMNTVYYLLIFAVVLGALIWWRRRRK